MASVFWANVAQGGAVDCEGKDRDALYRHQKALDALASRLGLPRLMSLVDTTDLHWNLGLLDVPGGDVDAAMLARGTWADADAALLLFEGLHAAVDVEPSLDIDAREAVRTELEDLLGFLRPRATGGARFNLAVVI